MTQFASILAGTGLTLRRSPESAAALHQLERTRGLRLPATFLELWSLEGIVEFLHEHTNADHPIAPSRLIEGVGHRWSRYDAFDDGYLPFMIENQGVTTWAIRLGNDDNPPVFVEVDSGSPPVWQPHAESLTGWLGCVINDASFLRQSWWQAQATELTLGDLAQLERRFARGPTTYAWPGEENLRFNNPAGRLLLWNGRGQTDWMIAPAQGQERALLADVLHLSNLRESLYAMDDEAQQTLRSYISTAR